VLAPNGVQLDRSSGPDGCYDLSGYADAITIWTTPNSRGRLPGYGDACVDAALSELGETWLCANHAVMVAPAVGVG
jgi:hypothetical protein